MNRPDHRLRALEALRVLGVRSPDGVVQRPDITRVRPGAVSGAVLDEVSFDLLPFGPAGELLVALIEGLDKLYPPDLDGYGVTSRDRLNPRSGHPFRSLAERVAEVVGAGEFELYVHRSRRGVGVELAEKPILLMPSWVMEQSESHQIFMLTRVLTLVSRHLHPVQRHRPADRALRDQHRPLAPAKPRRAGELRREQQ